MATRRGRQRELFGHSQRSAVLIEPTHRLVLLADSLDWDELLDVVEDIRKSKLKSRAGRPPQLRALVGAILLKATRDMTLREAEDLIRHYAPARYLCGLTDTDWSPDHNTLHDFEKLMGEDGVRRINEFVVKAAVKQKLADPSVAVGDTTAQEAAVPYPNEMRLMAAFMTSLIACSSKAGTTLKSFARAAATTFEEAKGTLRNFRLFAKTAAERMRGVVKMMRHVRHVQALLAPALSKAMPTRLRAYGKVAFARTKHLHDVMGRLLPQIDYWRRTGFVAANKIISLSIPSAYAVVRGKVGKPIEFGLNWGITRLRGGFLLAHLGAKTELHDSRYVGRSVEECRRLFGKAPTAYAYDRAGHNEKNVALLKRLGVKHIGLAPKGRAKWEVDDKMKQRLVSERVRVEGSIGTIKCARYGFNRPRARSEAMMGESGQRAVLGLNLNKLINGLAKRRGLVLMPM
jgi:Transposase domain (DUF772)